LDPEERKLQIRLAQLNAKLQADIAWAIGLYAAGIVWFIFGYQIAKENFNGFITAWIVASAFIVGAIGYVYMTRGCLEEFEKLK
jgi:hypothetical protein